MRKLLGGFLVSFPLVAIVVGYGLAFGWWKVFLIFGLVGLIAICVLAGTALLED